MYLPHDGAMTSKTSVSTPHTWYQIITPEDRVAVEAAAEWLRPVSWQWFVTLTFPWNVRAETADRKFKSWVDLVEHDLRSRMCFVAGKERKADTHGMNVPWHYHALVTSLAPISGELLQRHWIRLAGTGSLRKVDGAVVAESILVESYQGHKMGPEYCLKSMNDCFGEWRFRWLELFNPAIAKQTSRPNHRSNVQRRRFAGQKQHQEAHVLDAP